MSRFAVLVALLVTSSAAGQTWERIGFRELRAQTVLVLDDGAVIASRSHGFPAPWSRDTGLTYRSEDEGLTFDTLSIAGGNDAIYDIAQHPSGVLVASGALRAYRSTDGGETWSRTAPPLVYAGSKFEFETYHSATVASDGSLYLTAASSIRPDEHEIAHLELYCSTDVGVTWVRVGAVWTIPMYLGGALLDLGDQRLLVSTSNEDGSVVLFDFANGTSERVETGGRYHVHDAVRTADGAVLAVLSPSGPYRSSDEGRTWTLSNEGLPTISMSRIAEAPAGVILIGTASAGVFESRDNGLSWQSASVGLDPETDRNADGVPDAFVVYDLAVGPDGRVWAATSDGIYRTGAYVTAEATELPAGRFSVSTFPNPATASTTIEIRVPEPSEVHVTLVDVLGRTVMRVYDGLVSGFRQLPVGVSTLSPGVYVVRMEAAGSMATTRLTVSQ